MFQLNLNKLYLLYSATGILLLFVTNFWFNTVLYIIYCGLTYFMFVKLVDNTVLLEGRNSFFQNKLIPFLCGFPLTGILFVPLALIEFGKTYYRKLPNPNLFQKLAFFYLLYTILLTLFYIYIYIISKQNLYSYFLLIIGLVYTLVPIYLIGMVVKTQKNKAFEKSFS